MNLFLFSLNSNSQTPLEKPTQKCRGLGRGYGRKVRAQGPGLKWDQGIDSGDRITNFTSQTPEFGRVISIPSTLLPQSASLYLFNHYPKFSHPEHS